MAATTATQVPFAGFRDAHPAQLREAIVAEDREQFDEGFRRDLDAAAQTLRLDELDVFLAHWRRVAWSQQDMGHAAWRHLSYITSYRRATRPRRPLSAAMALTT